MHEHAEKMQNDSADKVNNAELNLKWINASVP